MSVYNTLWARKTALNLNLFGFCKSTIHMPDSVSHCPPVKSKPGNRHVGSKYSECPSHILGPMLISSVSILEWMCWVHVDWETESIITLKLSMGTPTPSFHSARCKTLHTLSRKEWAIFYQHFFLPQPNQQWPGFGSYAFMHQWKIHCEYSVFNGQCRARTMQSNVYLSATDQADQRKLLWAYWSFNRRWITSLIEDKGTIRSYGTCRLRRCASY